MTSKLQNSWQSRNLSWEHEQLVLSCLRRELDKKMPGIQRQVAQLRQEIAENEEEIDELLLMKAMINRR